MNGGFGFIGTPTMADIEELKARLEKLEAKVFPPEPPPSLVREQDIRVDIYRSERNAPMTLRLTHFPTGIVVTVEGEKSQLQNKAKALEELEAKLLEKGWHPMAMADGRYAHEIPGHRKWWSLLHVEHTGPIFSCPFCHPERPHSEVVAVHLAWCKENGIDPDTLWKKT